MAWYTALGVKGILRILHYLQYQLENGKFGQRANALFNLIFFSVIAMLGAIYTANAVLHNNTYNYHLHLLKVWKTNYGTLYYTLTSIQLEYVDQYIFT